MDLGPVWPSPDAVEHLVEKSSGLLIYPTTVVRFIDDEYSHPGDRLDAVLRLDRRSTAPLDDLYTEILPVVPHEPQHLRVLHAIWQGRFNTTLPPDPEEIDTVMELRTGTSRLALRHVHSLFHVPPIRARSTLPEGSILCTQRSVIISGAQAGRAGGACQFQSYMTTSSPALSASYHHHESCPRQLYYIRTSFVGSRGSFYMPPRRTL
ncbi:hypothetical protein B0H17DRAFT_314948 [Mycena rosella]|uniref:Uncharacterized protein n=1 Tax=Mycena rosella TaxID=1033263 RepID=A0AAD7CTZ5_MYCRO|nr:hypothetical protein B0H17DRAFT_314948 [Mycena rosella]